MRRSRGGAARARLQEQPLPPGEVGGAAAGRDLDDQLTPETAEQLGSVSARLHKRAESFRPPPGFLIKRHDRVLLWLNILFLLIFFNK